MLGDRRRRWPSIEPTFCQRFVFWHIWFITSSARGLTTFIGAWTYNLLSSLGLPSEHGILSQCCPVLVHRLRRCPNIATTLSEGPVLAEKSQKQTIRQNTSYVYKPQILTS